MKLFDKRIPMLGVIVVLLAGVIVTSILVQQGIIIFQNAAPSDNPQNVRITNISDSSFTVTYTTDTSVIGTITLTKDGEKPEVILDDRDEQSGVPKQYLIHSISAKNLSPNTSYTFTILSGTTTYLDNDKPFSLTTPDKLADEPSEQVPLAGKVLLPDGTKPDEALIFVTTQNGQMLSTLLNAAGLYILPLNTMRTKDLAQAMQFSQNTQLQLLIANQNLTSHVITGVMNINPVPPVTLSQDYDFTAQETPLATGSAETSFPILDFTQNTLHATPQIITPKKDESFTDQQPQFKGTAAPKSTVSISIHSDQAITTQVTTDANGNWTYRPTTPLSPGQHTITITSPDQYGILHTLTQTFTVYAAGSQVNQSATPSATLAPTRIPTVTTKPTIQPTSKPTIIPTILPTNTLTPTSAIKPTTHPTLPPTGSNTVAIAGVAGIATTVIGIVLFLITSGATL